MKEGDLTVIVARYGKGPARKYTLPRNLLLSLILTVAVLAGALSLSGLHYFSMWKKSALHSRLVAEVDDLRKENEGFRVSARRLNSQVSQLELTAYKLEIMAGNAEEGVGGRGGPVRSGAPTLDLDRPRDLKNHFNSLERRRISLRTELSRLQDYYTSRQILLAASPSILPVRGYPSDRYGWRKDPFTGNREFHHGIDISAPKGARVVATADGVVKFSGRYLGYGRIVVLQHPFGLSTRYGHLSKLAVKRGQRIKRGDTVGFVGSSGRATGSHVHFEVRLNQESLDPSRFFREWPKR